MAGWAEREKPIRKTEPGCNHPPMFYDTICILSVTSFTFSPGWELNTLFREVLTGVLLQFNIFAHKTHHYLGT